MATDHTDVEAVLKTKLWIGTPPKAHHDPDERCMALSDIKTFLETHGAVPPNSAMGEADSQERRIARAIIENILARDNVPEALSYGISCLAVVIKRAHRQSTKDYVLGVLADNVASSTMKSKPKDVSVRETWSNAFKTVAASSWIGTPSDDLVLKVIDKVLPVATAESETDGARAVQIELLDTVARLLEQFGTALPASKQSGVVDVMLDVLSSAQGPIRSRATDCLCGIAAALPDKALGGLVQKLMKHISASSGDEKATDVKVIGELSLKVGWRLGPFVDSIVPALLASMGNVADEVPLEEEEAINSLRANCLAALQSICSRCPVEAKDYVLDIRSVAMAFIAYNPSADGSDDDSQWSGSFSGSDDEGDGDESYYSTDSDAGGDEDPSEIVRLAAVKLLDAIIRTRTDLLTDFYTECAVGLLKRFSTESVDGVKQGVMGLFEGLLEATAVTVDEDTPAGPRIIGDTSISRAVADLSGAPPLLMRQVSSEVTALVELLDDLVKATQGVIESGKESRANEVCAWHLLRHIAKVTSGSFAPHVNSVLGLARVSLDRIKRAQKHKPESAWDGLRKKHRPLRLGALSAIRQLLDVCEPDVFVRTESVEATVSLALRALEDTADTREVQVEALNVIGRVSAMLRPNDPFTGGVVSSGAEFEPHVQPMFDAIMSRLSARDLDSDIKNASILSMGLFAAHLGDQLAVASRDQVTAIIMERAKHDATRVSALRALRFIANAHPDGSTTGSFDLSAHIGDAVATAAGYMTHVSREVKLASLQALTGLVAHHGAVITEDMIRAAFDSRKGAAALIGHADLATSEASLQLGVAVLRSKVAWASMLGDCVAAAVRLSSSDVLQGRALAACVAFFGELGSDAALRGLGTSMMDLLDRIRANALGEKESQRVTRNVAAIVAALVSDSSERDSAVSQLLSDVRSADDRAASLALLSIGEVGRRVDLSAHSAALLEWLDHDRRGSAASHALGGVCLGNMAVGMTLLREHLSAGSLSTASLLSALRVTLASHEAMPYCETVLPLIEAHADASDEGVRAAAAGCLGSLCGSAPLESIRKMVELSESKSAAARWTAATATRYAADFSHIAVVRQHLERNSAELLRGLTDTDVGVRRAALLALNAIVPRDIRIVLRFLRKSDDVDPDAGGAAKADEEPPLTGADIDTVGIFPVLFAMMGWSRIRKVDLGSGVKNEVDDGLLTRKAAFSCMGAILDHGRERVNANAFMTSLIGIKRIVRGGVPAGFGLVDKDDGVRMLCHQLLAKLCRWPEWQRQVLGNLESIQLGLWKSTRGLNELKGASQIDVTTLYARTALSAVHSIATNVPDADSVVKFKEYVRQLKEHSEIAAVLREMGADTSASSVSTAARAAGGAGGAGGP